MAFGNPITDFTIVAPDGTYGNIVSIPLLSSRMREVDFVQVLSAGGVYSDPVTVPVTEAELYAYLEDVNAPDVAFCRTNTLLFIFVKEGVYDPTDSAVRVGIVFWRNSIPIDDATDYIDIPHEAKSLFIAILNKLSIGRARKRIEWEDQQAVIREKNKLGFD